VRITVVGLGKIGLPLSVQYASKGHFVFGVDINQETVKLVNLGVEPFQGEASLSSNLKKVIDSKNLSASTELSKSVSYSEVVVVAVPLIVRAHGEPDFDAMDSATREIGKGLKAGTLVSYETTLPVGTTRNRLIPILERESGLLAGRDFFVTFSPERVLSGRVFTDLRRYPKLIGGLDHISQQKGVEFYEAVLDFDAREDLPKPNGVWALGTLEAAELSKLAETTYRDVNIALANQFAIHAESLGVDIYKVIEACNSQPFSHIHQPGVAVGGHCIPVYPHLYLQGDPEAKLVANARQLNDSMPAHVVSLLETQLGDLSGMKILILGLAYRGGVKEHAFSGTWELAKVISEKGGLPVVHDPMYSELELQKLGLIPHQLGQVSDAAILQTNHKEYKQLKAEDLPGVNMIVDGRNFLPDEVRSKLKVFVIGKGLSQKE
jgi:nucleotide sugar dehydrogenase